MSIADELNEGRDATKSIEEALRRIRDEATESRFVFASMSKEIGNMAGKSKDFREELKTSGKSIKALSTSAQQIARITKGDLKDKKVTQKLEKQALDTRKKVAETQSQINVLNDLAKNAQGEEKKRLLSTIDILRDGVSESERILRNFDRLTKTTEKLDKETRFIDKLAKGVKAIPGLGPLLAGPLEDASNSYRKMRLKEGASKMDAMVEGAKGLADAFGPAAVLGLLFKANQTTTNLARNLQISKDEAIRLKEEFNAVAINSGKAFLNQRNLAEATGQLVEHLGVARGFTYDIVKNQAFLTKQMGLSAQEAGEFNSLVMVTGADVEATKIQIADQVKLLEKETGVQLKLNKVVAAVAKAHAGLKAAYGFEIEEIAKQVVLTQKLGLEVEQTAKMASQLLDFESSIAKELEAELLTGKDLNLEEARLLALQGKSTEAAAELAKQVGGTVELSKMNVLQQEALAEAMGMERNELIQSVQKREVLARLGVQNIEQLAEAGELERLKGDAMGEQLLKQYEQESAAEKFQAAVIKIQEALGTMLEGPLGSMLDTFASIVSNATSLKIIMGTIIGLSFARVIASIISMGASLATAGVGSITLASGLTLGIGAAAIAAGIGVAFAAMSSASDQAASRAKQRVSVNDFSMIGGRQNLNLDEGGLTLEANRKDMFLMGGTNLLNSNNNNNQIDERVLVALEESKKINKQILAKDTNVIINSKLPVTFEQKQGNAINELGDFSV